MKFKHAYLIRSVPEIARNPTKVRVPSSLTKTSKPDRSTQNDDPASFTDPLTPATNGCIQWCLTVTTLVRLIIGCGTGSMKWQQPQR